MVRELQGRLYMVISLVHASPIVSVNWLHVRDTLNGYTHDVGLYRKAQVVNICMVDGPMA
jgi:hypothetical protein